MLNIILLKLTSKLLYFLIKKLTKISMDEELEKPIILRIAGDKNGRRSFQIVSKAESSANQNGILIYSFNIPRLKTPCHRLT